MKQDAITVSAYSQFEQDRSFVIGMLMRGWFAYEVAKMLEVPLSWVEHIQLSLLGQ